MDIYRGYMLMKYAGIIKNDIAAGEGVNVSFFT
jgi:hypothetical protein